MEPQLIDMAVMDTKSGIMMVLNGVQHDLNYEDAKFLIEALSEVIPNENSIPG